MPINDALGCYYVFAGLGNLFEGGVVRQCNTALAIGLGTLGYVGKDGLIADGSNAFETYQAAKAYSDKQIGSKIEHAGGQVLSAGEQVAHFFSMLTQRETLVRIAEVVLGLTVLGLAVGAFVLNTESGKEAITTATGVAKKVVK